MLWRAIQEYCTKKVIKKYGESSGKIFFRCIECRAICTMKGDVEKGGCRVCGGRRLKEAYAGLWEEVKHVFF
jgi:hypothetical protein